MESQTDPRILEAERLGDGILITFDDGTSAIYPAALILAMLPHAQPLNDLDADSAGDG